MKEYYTLLLKLVSPTSRCLIFGLLNGVVLLSPSTHAKASNIPQSSTHDEVAHNVASNLQSGSKEKPTSKSFTDEEVRKYCIDSLSKLKLSIKPKELEKICQNAHQIPECVSAEGHPIFHFEQQGQLDKKTKTFTHQKVLSISLIHGDEEESAAVTLAWLDRLRNIEPRNTWRIIPIMNPDGWQKKTRTNANGIDVNRNFPSHDWHQSAIKYWKKDMKENPRRFPGEEPGSEPETKCAMAHIEMFNPNFIISIHTPLGVLDFDGPKLPAPQFSPLPWVSLGNYPGSLGRYMWIDRKVPVLTVELKRDGLKHLEQFDRLQDITGTVAIQAEKLIKKSASTEKNASR